MMFIEAILTYQFSARRGHRSSELTAPSVFHSGNYELVCLRHRETQTLYVSDLIEPPTCKDPGYGKLQVGIYVAAVQDMIDHAKQRLHRSQPKSFEGDDGGDPASGDNEKYDQNDDCGNPYGGERKRGRFQGGAGRKDSSVNELDTTEIFCPNLISFQIYLTTTNIRK
jgi:hypothetical protein